MEEISLVVFSLNYGQGCVNVGRIIQTYYPDSHYPDVIIITGERFFVDRTVIFFYNENEKTRQLTRTATAGLYGENISNTST